MIRPHVTLARPIPPPRPRSSVGRSGIAGAFPVAPFSVTGSATMSFYPAVLDITPALVDKQSPMVALWINLLQSMVEAVEAEIGPFPSGIVRNHMPTQVVNSLQKLLGQQTDASAVSTNQSYAGLCSAVTGNSKPAGTLYGVQRVQVTRSSWTQATDYTATITNPFGRPPGWKRPIAWGYPRLPSSGVSMATLFATGPAKVVAMVNSTSDSTTTTTYNMKWAAVTCDAGAAGANLTPTNGPSYTMDICIMYLPTEQDA